MSYNPDNYVTFVSLRPNNNYSFTGYTESETGDIKIISDRVNPQTGEPEPRRFFFRRDKRFLKIPKAQKDRYGNSVVEHLRNAPECAGSPNGHYDADGKQVPSTVWFKELNDAKDAEILVASKMLRKKAADIAFALTGDELRSMAELCGRFTTNTTLQTMAVIEYAEAAPEQFINLYKSPDRTLRSLLRAGVSEGKIKKVGTMLQWEGVTLGSNEDDAVSKLVSDESLQEAIKSSVYGITKPTIVKQPEPVVDTEVADKKRAAMAKARAARGKK